MMGAWSKEAAIAAAGLTLTMLTTITGSVWNLRSYLQDRDAAFSVELSAIQAQLQLLEFRLAMLEGDKAP